MSRRNFLRGAAASTTLALPLASPAAQGGKRNGQKVFRWAFPIAETGFDPAQISDLYSNFVLANIFETPLHYDYLAPTVLKPRNAAALPETSADFRTFTVRVRPGIYFQDDPAFKGKKRELIAADFVY